MSGIEYVAVNNDDNTIQYRWHFGTAVNVYANITDHVDTPASVEVWEEVDVFNFAEAPATYQGAIEMIYRHEHQRVLNAS